MVLLYSPPNITHNYCFNISDRIKVDEEHSPPYIWIEVKVTDACVLDDSVNKKRKIHQTIMNEKYWIQQSLIIR